MLSIRSVSKSFGIQPVLQKISFNISTGERLGLIGPNGSGKTTLIRILAGLDTPDSGAVVSTRSDLRIGYLAQGLDLPQEYTLQAGLRLDEIPLERLAASISRSMWLPKPQSR